MKFGVLALDYDGTIANDGFLDADVRAAIGEVRAHGIAVVLVTGRILADLARKMGDLCLVDVVVAENGALLAFPNGQSRALACPPPPVFLETLRRWRVNFEVGHCVVEADAFTAPTILAAIRELELPLVIAFNRSRLMVLPQGVSKGLGLREALGILRLSPHNAIGIGDSENDHALLAECELGVAVEWGSPALQHSADEVLRGQGPSAVADYIRRAAQEIRIPPESRRRTRLTLGATDAGDPLNVGLRGRNLLIMGDSQSGKSWLTGLVCEQLILQRYSLCVIDPEGDYRTLESLPGVVVFGSDRAPPDLPALMRVLRHPGMSVIIDLAHMERGEKVSYLNTLLPVLAAHRRTTGLPHRIVVDEAHYFLHESEFRELLDLSLRAYLLVTYRLSDLHPELRKDIESVIVTHISDELELQTLLAMAGSSMLESEWKTALRGLAINQAILLPEAAEGAGRPVLFHVAPRLTVHSRHESKYLDVRLIRSQGFVFTDNGKMIGSPVRTLHEFLSALGSLPADVLKGHAVRGDFSRWIAEVYRDHALASDIHTIERQFRGGHIPNLSESITQAIQTRYQAAC